MNFTWTSPGTFPGGEGVLGLILLGMCRWPLRAPTRMFVLSVKSKVFFIQYSVDT